MRTSIALLFITLLSSCEKWEIDKEELNPETSYSISCYLLASGTLHTVNVFSLRQATESILNEDLNDLVMKNASVSITEVNSGNSFQLGFVDSLNAYASEFILIEGARYNLRVNVGNKEMTSSCEIPRKPQITSNGIELDILSDNIVNVKVSWKAPYFSAPYTISNRFRFGNSSTNFLTIGNVDVLDSPDPFTLEHHIDSDFSIPLVNFNKATFELNIHALSNDLGILTSQYGQSNAVIGVNRLGFFQRFVPLEDLHSNINNGYGIFGAYNRLKIEEAF